MLKYVIESVNKEESKRQYCFTVFPERRKEGREKLTHHSPTTSQ